jgi:hypothetical protein
MAVLNTFTLTHSLKSRILSVKKRHTLSKPLSHRHHQLITSLAKTMTGSDNLPINVMYIAHLVAVLAKCRVTDDLVFASA